MSVAVRNVVIVGGGTAGWMAAAAFGKLLGKQLNITLIESDEIPTVGVGEATIPPIQAFHRLLGIDESEFMRASQGTFKVGIKFENWGVDKTSYFHSFGSTGKGFWGGDFQHLWLRGRQLGINTNFSEYCLETQAAQANCFTKNTNPNINYAYHFDAGLYAKFLRKFSESFSVKRVEGNVESVDQDATTGNIKSVRLASGAVVQGDFFIDCSGFKGLLIEQALHTGYEDWSQWLLCDTAIAVQTESVGELFPYTVSTAHDCGWRWRIPLQSRTGNGLVYSSKFKSEDDARQLLLSNLQGETITSPRVIKFKPGKRRKGWNKNCVALGLASGFLEPLESTSIHLVMTGVMRTMLLFPYDGNFDVLSAEYNAQLADELVDIRDFIIAHYCVGEIGISPFWDYCREMNLPESLRHRLDLFKQTGQFFKKQDELFRVDSWTQVMIGQGIIPKGFHPAMLQIADADIIEFLNGYHDGIAKHVISLPKHSAFIAEYCKGDIPVAVGTMQVDVV